MSDKYKRWARAAFIRAVRTMAQAAVMFLGTGVTGILDVDWITLLSASALAGLLSILTSAITGLPEVELAETGATIQQGYNIDPQELLLEDGEVVSYDYDCQNIEAEE